MGKSASSTGVRRGVLYIYVSLLLALCFGLASSSLTARWMTPGELGTYRFVISCVSVIASGLTFGLFSSAGTLLAGRVSRRVQCLVAGGAITHSWLVATGCVVGVATVFFVDAQGLSRLTGAAAILAGAMAWPLLLQEILRAKASFIGLAILNAAPSAVFLVLLSASQMMGWTVDAPLAATLFFFSQGMVTLLLILHNGITLLPDPLGHAHLLKRNRNLGLNVYWATFLAALTAQAGVFALQVFRSAPDVAIFALAVTMSAPLTMLPGAMGTAYFSRLPGAIGFPPRVLACAWGLSIAVATVFCLVAPLAVNVLYGDHYDAVTSSAQLCAVGAVLHGMGDVYNRYYLANRQTNLLLRIAFLTCFVSIITCIPAAIFFGPLGVGAARLIASALYVSMLAYKYHGVRYRFGSA